ncbi:RNA polymerase sigma-70 factor [Chondrinema litorale]|uniref:RNA polymerase sigma-70 factor n=1 Tax=Chondrinema litorale TaxID=2994555 RepID=UPI002543C9ED|nr:RNA polymerase sigma-70 factor [Chondrinema litorale]UZR99485.1 RNA polymerase sigma-70 factor [Chondrinema litorale]
MQTLNNKDIAIRIKEGDFAALEKLYQNNWIRLVNFSFGMLKSKEDAEEAVQDIFIRVWENREKLNPELPINGFLFVVAKRVVLNKLRSKAKELQMVDIHENDAWRNCLAEDQLIYSELTQISEHAIDKLPPKRKEIFLLRKNQGLTNKEIAGHLNVSTQYVEKQMALALSTIRAYLQAHTDIILPLILLFISL